MSDLCLNYQCKKRPKTYDLCNSRIAFAIIVFTQWHSQKELPERAWNGGAMGQNSVLPCCNFGHAPFHVATPFSPALFADLPLFIIIIV